MIDRMATRDEAGGSYPVDVRSSAGEPRAPPLVRAALWNPIQSLLPSPPKPEYSPGRPTRDDCTGPDRYAPHAPGRHSLGDAALGDGRRRDGLGWPVGWGHVRHARRADLHEALLLSSCTPVTCRIVVRTSKSHSFPDLRRQNRIFLFM